jgi:ABC-type dipeptide/oligopeptide/nickel transport system permease subunit
VKEYWAVILSLLIGILVGITGGYVGYELGRMPQKPIIVQIEGWQKCP